MTGSEPARGNRPDATDASNTSGISHTTRSHHRAGGAPASNRRPPIVGPLWFGVFALVCGALLVLATAVVFGYESAPMQWPVFVLLFACSAFVVGATTRMRLTTTQQTSDTGLSADQ
ncbi:hypothetical protein [Halostagnicola kamekurae]|uniref:NfeD-like C-terminal, partner-binding n=1 Tax=Halostagnicola kamekurae TaxID=619731 RepID=A0A1I6NZE8_9EURY|nr:hypothetical protein [Halostagnicola kamekurae]SFS33220.1 NfeD-like C-terminal, partner-binding [Halostagnicola kamekurae]